ncbi:MAG TPA: flagellar hook-basal body complex protein FliE [Bryobacteraceae bacterium]|jgi:flagellar hook-basal body complex protein FliE|nr:flagellar hook-basal body complex protein FliE [Bryobacteraceae bacterium]
MTMKLSGIQPIAPIAPMDTPSISSTSSTGSSGGSSFSEILNGAIGEVEGARSSANQSVERFLSGEGEDLHSTILASQRADLEFQMFMQVRNKIVSAYQEIMKLQM